MSADYTKATDQELLARLDELHRSLPGLADPEEHRRIGMKSDQSVPSWSGGTRRPPSPSTGDRPLSPPVPPAHHSGRR